MRRFRFKIASLLGVILFLGVGLAGLRESNDLWESGLFTLTLGVLLVSILLAVHRSEVKRAFWIGFAIIGWGYMAIALIPSIEPRLLTTKALAYLDSKVSRPIPAGVAYADLDNDGMLDIYLVNNSQTSALYLNKGNGTFQDVTLFPGSNPAGSGARGNRLVFPNNSGGPWLRRSTGTTGNFIRIGHSLLALVAAWLGGQLSRRVR
jgi:hypothetical protein